MSRRTIVFILVVVGALGAAAVTLLLLSREPGKGSGGGGAAERPATRHPGPKDPLGPVPAAPAAPAADAAEPLFPVGPTNETDNLVAIPDEGPFWRGHPDEPPHPFGNPDTQPMRAIRLDAFRIDRTEVTMGEYGRCVSEGACRVPVCDEAAYAARSEQPVTCVSWDDAAAYCRFVSKRLPTEAEWEKAARGMDGRKYPWGGDPPACTVALFNACQNPVPDPPGSRPDGASPYGIEDLAGNVAEWVADWYGPDYYRLSPDENPRGPESGGQRVVRGGSYAMGSRYLMTGYRTAAPQETRRPDLGFRCAADAAP